MTLVSKRQSKDQVNLKDIISQKDVQIIRNISIKTKYLVKWTTYVIGSDAAKYQTSSLFKLIEENI